MRHSKLKSAKKELIVKTVILCGGFGTRIRDVSESLPKPMINIGPYPILFHIMKYYSYFSHKEFVLCLGYKSHVIKDFFLNYRVYTSDFQIDFDDNRAIKYLGSNLPIDWKVTLAETGLNTMTGGRVKKVAKYIGQDDNFMLTYGDGVGDIDLDELLQFHKYHGKILTVTGVHPPGRFGEIASTPDHSVIGFNEKPQSSGGRISGGFFVCKREIFEYLDDRESLVFEKDPINDLVRDNQMKVFPHNGFWQPMDTHREFLLLNNMYKNSKAPWIREKFSD